MTRFVHFLAGAVGVGLVALGCGLLAPAKSPRAEKFDCQVRALEPLVGEILDSRELLRALYAGQADLGAVLASSGATAAEVRALVEALNDCEPPVELPEGGFTAS